jgi:NAD(P) transhydrogenase subunit alpha
MADERATKQRELLTPYVAASDAVISTAAVPGRAAPLLITREMVEAMRPGSVIVDLAAESGGNCELSVAGQAINHGGVIVWGAKDVASSMPLHASQLYARNVSNLLLLMTNDGRVEPDWDDEIVSSACVTRDPS